MVSYLCSIVADQVHLVDGQHEIADADQMREIGVTPRLREHAFARIDQNHRKVCGRGAGHHVARVLFMARRIGDDEFALLGGEEPVGHIDGDALFALRGQAVHQQREIDVLALGSDTLGVGLQRRELILEDHLRVVQQASDERGFAVIDAAAGDEAQQALVLMLLQVGVDVLGDQRIRLITLRPARWSSEVSFLFLLLHAGRLIVIDGAALAFGGLGQQHFLDDLGQRVRLALTAPVNG